MVARASKVRAFSGRAVASHTPMIAPRTSAVDLSKTFLEFFVPAYSGVTCDYPVWPLHMGLANKAKCGARSRGEGVHNEFTDAGRECRVHLHAGCGLGWRWPDLVRGRAEDPTGQHCCARIGRQLPGRPPLPAVFRGRGS